MVNKNTFPKPTPKDMVKLQDPSGSLMGVYTHFKLRPLTNRESVLGKERINFCIDLRSNFSVTTRFKKVAKFARSLSRQGWRIIQWMDFGHPRMEKSLETDFSITRDVFVCLKVR